MSSPRNEVRIEHLNGEWAVFVVEDGKTTERRFEQEEWALNFADGQRARLAVLPDEPNAVDEGGF
jgi:hypothetical protein